MDPVRVRKDHQRSMALVCDEAVKRLKRLITSYPVLRQYDPGRKLP